MFKNRLLHRLRERPEPQQHFPTEVLPSRAKGTSRMVPLAEGLDEGGGGFHSWLAGPYTQPDALPRLFECPVHKTPTYPQEHTHLYPQEHTCTSFPVRTVSSFFYGLGSPCFCLFWKHDINFQCCQLCHLFLFCSWKPFFFFVMQKFLFYFHVVEYVNLFPDCFWMLNHGFTFPGFGDHIFFKNRI